MTDAIVLVRRVFEIETIVFLLKMIAVRTSLKNCRIAIIYSVAAVGCELHRRVDKRLEQSTWATDLGNGPGERLKRELAETQPAVTI